MSLRLVPPGKRKGNRFYILRGTIGGRDVEVSTKTADKVAARKFKADFERGVAKSGVPRPGEAVTFNRAADAYIAFRHPEKFDLNNIDRLRPILGAKIVSEMLPADIASAAQQLYPAQPSARLRQVYTPASSILHYAAENGWCAWLRLKRPKQKRPETRSVNDAAKRLLIANAEGDMKLILVWLFCQGTRITDTLNVDGRKIDLQARTVEMRIGKKNDWRLFPLDDAVWELLANVPAERFLGRLFPWRSRQMFYLDLAPLTKRLRVHFTPHMARHTLGKELNAAGVGLRTIMEILAHTDVKSSVRYQSVDMDAVRAAQRKKLGNSGGNDGK